MLDLSLIPALEANENNGDEEDAGTSTQSVEEGVIDVILVGRWCGVHINLHIVLLIVLLDVLRLLDEAVVLHLLRVGSAAGVHIRVLIISDRAGVILLSWGWFQRGL